MNRYRLIFAAVAVCICTSVSAQTPLDKMEIPGNTANWLDLRQQAIQEQNRLLNQQVGDALARGNFEGPGMVHASCRWRCTDLPPRLR